MMAVCRLHRLIFAVSAVSFVLYAALLALQEDVTSTKCVRYDSQWGA